MTNAQLWLAVGVPVVAILISMGLNLLQIFAIRDDVKQIRVKMQDLRREMQALRTEVHAEMQAMTTKLDLLTGKVYELMNR